VPRNVTSTYRVVAVFGGSPSTCAVSTRTVETSCASRTRASSLAVGRLRAAKTAVVYAGAVSAAA